MLSLDIMLSLELLSGAVEPNSMTTRSGSDTLTGSCRTLLWGDIHGLHSRFYCQHVRIMLILRIDWTLIHHYYTLLALSLLCFPHSS
jgi:hypothetical protein